MSKAHADLDTAIHNSAATEYDKGNILFLAEKYAESQTELLKRQLAAVDKRLRQGNRNARIDEQMRTELSALGTYIVVKDSNGVFVDQRERIHKLKQGENDDTYRTR